jgi:hypothetical protein
VIVQRILAVWRQERRELHALRVGEARAHTDVLEAPGVVEQPEEKRAHSRLLAALVPAKAGDDTVAFALVLHLQHDALVRLIGARFLFRDHAVETRSLEALEPVGGSGAIVGGRSEMDRRIGPLEQRLECSTPLAEGSAAEVAISLAEQVEEHHRCGSFAGQLRHARRRGMEAKLERLEVETSVAHDDDLSVQHAALRELCLQRIDELGEVALERLLVATLDEDLIAVTEDQRTEPVPLGLEDPPGADGKLGDALGEHREDRGIERKLHARNANARSRELECRRPRPPDCRGARDVPSRALRERGE